MFGSHLSIAGGLHNALLAARGFGMACVQVFTRNQQQWHARPLALEAVKLWRARDGGSRRRAGRAPAGVGCLGYFAQIA